MNKTKRLVSCFHYKYDPHVDNAGKLTKATYTLSDDTLCQRALIVYSKLFSNMSWILLGSSHTQEFLKDIAGRWIY